MKLFKAIGKVASLAVPVAIAAVQPEAVINTVLGAGLKHGKGVIKKLPNNTIPALNFALSTGVCLARHGLTTGDWAGGVVPAIQEATGLTAASTAIHQTTKLPIRSLTGRSV